jgi:hypothetical protein
MTAFSIHNTGSSSSVSSTTCTAPVENNMPAAGESFTIVCDIPVVESGACYSIGDSVDYIGSTWSSGSLQIQHSLGTWVSNAITTSKSFLRSVVVCSCDSSTSTLNQYIDGELISTSSFTGFLDLPSDGTVKAGKSRTLAGNLNSTLGAIKIYHSALTADQVKVLGVAQ